jgi:hypothetical protein
MKKSELKRFVKEVVNSLDKISIGKPVKTPSKKSK